MGVLIFLVGAFVVFSVSESVSRPVRELTAATGAFSSGNYDTRVEISAKDEVGNLGESFNEMAETIERALVEIERRRNEAAETAEHLRQEVAERERAENERKEQRALSVRSDRLRSLGEMAAGIARELNQRHGGAGFDRKVKGVGLRRRQGPRQDDPYRRTGGSHVTHRESGPPFRTASF